MKRVVLILALLLSTKVWACDCEEFTREYEESISGLIFIGTIVESNPEYYLIRIDELLKNTLNIEDSLLEVVVNSCSIVAEPKESWLIYANYEADQWQVNYCGYSTNLGLFGRKVSSKVLPPRPLNYTDEELEMITKIQDMIKANQTYFDITNLRIKKLREDLLSQDLADSDEPTEISKNEDRPDFGYWLLVGLNLIVVILLIAKFKSPNRMG